MPTLGKQWLLIDGNASGREPGGVIAEDFGPSERLNEKELKAALLAADAAREDGGVLIDSEGQTHQISKHHLEDHLTLIDVHENNLGSPTPVEEFVQKVLESYWRSDLTAEYVEKLSRELSEEMGHLDNEMRVLAKRYRKHLEAAIEAVYEEEADLATAGKA